MAEEGLDMKIIQRVSDAFANLFWKSCLIAAIILILFIAGVILIVRAY